MTFREEPATKFAEPLNAETIPVLLNQLTKQETGPNELKLIFGMPCAFLNSRFYWGEIPMTEIPKETKNHNEACTALCELTLERARRRYAGEEVPVTSDDKYWTMVMISIPTYYLDRNTRLNVLMSVIGNMLAGIRPTKVRSQAFEQVLRLLREYVDDAVKKGGYRNRPKKIEIKVERGKNGGRGALDPYDFALADETFDRALRRCTGEDLEVTDEDLHGTLALIQQLMTDIDYVLLIGMMANAIVEEYDGPPPNAVFCEFRRLVRRTISESDLMNGRSMGR